MYQLFLGGCMVRFEEEAVKASGLPERITGRSRVVRFGFLKQGNSYLSRVPMLGGETDTASEPQFISDPMADVALRRVGEDLEVILVAKAAGRFELHVDERDVLAHPLQLLPDVRVDASAAVPSPRYELEDIVRHAHRHPP